MDRQCGIRAAGQRHAQGDDEKRQAELKKQMPCVLSVFDCSVGLIESLHAA